MQKDKLYQADRWKWHPNENVTVFKKKNKTEKEIKEDKKFMQIIDNLPTDYFDNNKS